MTCDSCDAQAHRLHFVTFENKPPEKLCDECLSELRGLEALDNTIRFVQH